MKHSVRFPSMHNLNVRLREVPTGMIRGLGDDDSPGAGPPDTAPAPGTAERQAFDKDQRELIRQFQERMVWWEIKNGRWLGETRYLYEEPPKKTADVAAGLAQSVVALDNHIQEWQVWLRKTRASVNYVADIKLLPTTDMQIQVLERCQFLLIKVVLAVKRMWELATAYYAGVVKDENAAKAKAELYELCREFLREMFNPNLEWSENEYMVKMVKKEKGPIKWPEYSWAYVMQLAYHTYVHMGAVYDVVKEKQKLAFSEWYDARKMRESYRLQGAKA